MFTIIKTLIDLFFSKPKEVPTKKDEDSEYIKEMNNQLEMLNQYDFKNINLPKLGTSDSFFGNKNIKNDNLKNILIVDDLEDIDVLYLRAFKAIKVTNDKKNKERNVYKDFNVYSTFENNCGAIAFNFIKNNRIDYAILDITLGYLTNLDNGKYVTIDGIDLAVEIWKRYPTCHVVFSTVHTCNQKNPTINKYFKKFNILTGKNLEDYYIEKNSEHLYEELEKFLYS